MAHVADHLSVVELEVGGTVSDVHRRLLGTALSDDLAAGAGSYN
jgi:hypothetical protein